MNNQISFITGIWDLDRDKASNGWQRSFDHYLNNFIILLSKMKDYNLIIFIDPSLEGLIWEHRYKKNTKVYHHSKNQFNGSFFPFFDKVQTIRRNPEWYNQVDWLKDSTQGSLEYYNPMVMSKMFLLHNAKCFDPFGSEYFYWIDGGLNNTMDLGYFNNPIVIDHLIKLSKKFLFITFPYSTDTEIHGFDIKGMRKYCQDDNINRVARGGFFGGHKNSISIANETYYSLLNDTLDDGYMGTEESIFTIMTYLDPFMYRFESINDDGLIYTFFENLQQSKISQKINTKTSLYINTFNSPEQLRMVIDSFESHDKSLLEETEIILINNSTNESLFDKYDMLASEYNMTQLKMGNIGICGARQLAAEHFANSSSEYMLFFEDDMLLDYNGECPFGFQKKIKHNLLDSIINIMQKEKYHFLKLSFSEFYGHNGEQWSWHNMPEEKRIKYFGKINKRPITSFNKIKSINSIPYAEGEIYYSNWPHIINQEGNRLCFLDTKWANPFEQTWMSHIYSLTKNNIVKPAVLLASPITHNRVYHYDKDDRKEN